MTGHHGGVRIPGPETRRDVERRGIREVLLHARQVGADSQSRGERAAILTMGALQGIAAGREGRFPQGGIEHAADLRIARVTAAGQDDGPASPDADRLPLLLDISILPVAL